MKSLTEYFGLASSVGKAEQTSDWGLRPLTHSQLKYAALDVVYLRGVHLKLLELRDGLDDPATADIGDIESQLLAIEPEFQRLKQEHDYLRELLKDAMIQQRVDCTEHYNLQRSEWSPVDVSARELAALIVEHGLIADVAIRLNKETVAGLGVIANQLENLSEPVERITLRKRKLSGETNR